MLRATAMRRLCLLLLFAVLPACAVEDVEPEVDAVEQGLVTTTPTNPMR